MIASQYICFPIENSLIILNSKFCYFNIKTIFVFTYVFRIQKFVFIVVSNLYKLPNIQNGQKYKKYKNIYLFYNFEDLLRVISQCKYNIHVNMKYIN